MSDYLPGLYIVSTPIGNLEDITLRALNVLKNSDQILCEDTRRSIKLLNHYKIKKKLVSNHKFNEKKVLNTVVEFIQKGNLVSIITNSPTGILGEITHWAIENSLELNDLTVRRSSLEDLFLKVVSSEDSVI